MPATTTSRPEFDDKVLCAVERIVGELVERHEALLLALAEHRAALTSADPARLGKSLEACADLLQEIAGLEDERRALFGEGDHAKSRTTIAQVAARMDEPRKRRLLELGSRLKGLIETVRTEQASLAQAAGSLASHMEGLIRQVAAKLSRTGAYGRDGRVGEGPAVVTALDIQR
ncbi:MAG: flagellar export chaperone FlgN [Phycisphaerales bacterium]